MRLRIAKEMLGVLAWTCASTLVAGCGGGDEDALASSGRDGSISASDGNSSDARASDAASVDSERAVGPEGGELRAGGLELSIPEGALEDDVEIRIRVVPEPVELPIDWEASGEFYEITPHGLRFAVPVTIELPYDGDNDESLSLMKLDDEDDETWAEADVESFEDGHVRFSTSGLSFYTVVRRCPFNLDSLEPGAVITGCESRECGPHPQYAVCGSCGRCQSGGRCGADGHCQANESSIDAGGSVSDAGGRAPDGGADGAAGTDGDPGSAGAGGTATAGGGGGSASDEGSPSTAIAAGFSHACRIREIDSHVACWGADTDGQVSGVPEGVAFDRIAASGWQAGSGHSCGIRADNGRVECWGSDDFGQVSGATAASFDELELGPRHTCGLRSDDDTWECWGQGDPSILTDVLTGNSLSLLAIGDDFACGLIAQSLATVCWGDDSYGQVSDLPGGAPQSPALGFLPSALAAGGGHVCGLSWNVSLMRAQVVCWGRNDFNQVTDLPSPVFGVPEFRSISAGFAHSCVGHEDDTVTCWGDDTHGQVSGVPQATALSAVAAGGDFTCALRADDGHVVCWGSNDFGQTSP